MLPAKLDGLTTVSQWRGNETGSGQSRYRKLAICRTRRPERGESCSKLL
uniref:Uncharacterized protein n=1 Tax=Enterobacter sp. HP19 TaxID=1811975 RepID=A0A2H4UE88_9ENTR|nr:hypothetical protein [Enterobacter sp. HP19]